MRPANPRIKGVNDQEPPDTPVYIEGLGIHRIFEDLATDRNRNFNMDEDEMEAFFEALMAPKKKNLSPEQQLDANKRFDEAMLKYKGILYDDMRHTEKTYGRLLNQLHPQDIAPQMGSGAEEEKYYRFLQDAGQMLKDGTRYFDFENNEDDKHFNDLTDFYFGTHTRNVTYNNGALALHLSSNELSEYINNPITDQADAVEEKSADRR